MEDLPQLEAYIRATPCLRALRGHLRARPAVDPGHDEGHALRVAWWTVRLIPAGGSRRDAIAAALLHDAVNAPKNGPDRARASARSAAFARQALLGLGFEPDAVAEICAAIRDHSFSRGAVPRGGLGQALQDADRLDALGAVGILRTVSTGARMGARYFCLEDPWAAGRELDDTAFTVDHFFRKLLRLPATMHTAKGRAEAERRAAFMRAFLEELGVELGRGAPGGPREHPDPRP